MGALVSYLLFNNKFPLNVAVENNEYLLSHTVSGSQGFGKYLAGWFWLWVFHKGTIKVSFEAAIF